MKKPDFTGAAVVAGDLGGTKIRLGIFDVGSGEPVLVEEFIFQSAQFGNLSEVLDTALRSVDVHGWKACFGVAGPVTGRTAKLTNLPWTVDARFMEERFGFASVRLINDLEATAWAVPGLGGESLVQLKRGEVDPQGHCAVIAAGTGLGQCGLVFDGSALIPVAGEGGHVDFAPQSTLQWELREFLARRHQHVSYERILSGTGLADVATFLFQREGRSFDEWMSVGGHEDAAAAISESADAGADATCVAALRLFVEVFGAQAGNLALTLLATGGVYLAGGIAVRNRRWFEEKIFVRAFTDKGRMSALVEQIPIFLILDEAAPLLGAARCAVGGSGGARYHEPR